MTLIQFIERTENIFGEKVEREITIPIDNIAYINTYRIKEKHHRNWEKKEFKIVSKEGVSWMVDEQIFLFCKEALERQ